MALFKTNGRQMEEREGKRNKYYRLDQTCSVARAEDLIEAMCLQNPFTFGN